MRSIDILYAAGMLKQASQAAEEVSPSPEGSKWGNGFKTLGAHIAASVGIPLAAQGYVGLSNFTHAQGVQEEAASHLREKLRAMGFSIDDVRMVNTISGPMLNTVQPAGAAADVYDKKVYLHPKSHPSIVAHEMGHALGPKWLTGMRLPGFVGSGLMNLKSLLSSDKDTAQRDALISSGILAAGTLPSELDASIKGFRELSKLPTKMGFGSKVKAFVGLPTYAAGAAVPYLTYLLRDKLNVFDKPKA